MARYEFRESRVYGKQAAFQHLSFPLALRPV
jgi:hypothetical protein